MSFNIRVVASGIIALCLVLSAIFYMESVLDPSMQALGNRFFRLGVALVFVVIVLTLVGVRRIKFP